MLGNGVEMSSVFHQILGPLALGWAPNNFVLGAQLALGEKSLVCIPEDINKINDPQKKYRLGTVSKNILLEGLNRFHDAPTSPLVQMWIKTHRCLVCMKDP